MLAFLVVAVPASAVPPVFGGLTSLPSGANPQGVAAADLNGDGRADIATADLGADSSTVLLNSGGEAWTGAPETPVAVGAYPSAILLSDVNRDGVRDIITANSAASTVSVALGGPGARFERSTASVVGAAPVALAVGDLNGDGVPEIVSANQGSDDATILAGSAPPTTVRLGASPRGIGLADLNGDGKLDLVAANSAGDSISVLLGNGRLGFTPAPGSPVAMGVGTGPRALLVHDLNGDQRPDLAVVNGLSGTIALLAGTGSGSFTPIANPPLSVGVGANAVAEGDLNGDGRSELVVSNGPSAEVHVFASSPTGVFARTPTSPNLLPAGASPQSVAIADLNDDARPDIATASFGSSAVHVLTNTTPGLPGLRFGTATPTLTGAIISGTLDPGGLPTNYRVEWGPTTAYGNQSASPTALTGSQFQAVTVQLLGLPPNAPIHYRLVAQNASGQVATPDRMLTSGAALAGIAAGDRTAPVAVLQLPPCRPVPRGSKARAIRACATYRRRSAAWLRLSGIARDPSGITGVQVSVVRRDSRGRCATYTGLTWIGTQCSRQPTVFVSARLLSGNRWTFKLSQPPRGPHFFAIRAIDKAGNVQTSLTVRRLSLPR